ncbi:Shedu anti-phage system protein SduA domain-containing protein [Paenibacillus sp. FSL L8-0340]|uniref:Shedu anti-phage system protein SduA domain-containing protein n=1 Tax=Paenibacillus sp. FSL L8-0340 TaxID=2954685 RepID=UPI00315991EE
MEKEKEGMIGTLKTKNLFREYPKAVRHNKSLFPNNYLDFVELDNREEIESTVEQFLTKLNDKSIKNEIDVLKFINKDTRAFYLIGSIFNYYDFGHHDAYVFPEFQLSEMYKVDYLLIGKNSDGYSFIFVELEHPVKDITLKSGELGNAFRKGINQLKDWQTLLITNFAGVTNTLKKYKHPDVQLPDEFYTLDPTRFHYTVVAGRRDDLADKTRKIRREHQIQQGIKLLHYDNICDNTLALLNQRNY